MKQRLVIPAMGPEGVIVSAHFGRAPYFAVVDIDESGKVTEKKNMPNTGEHSGGRGHAHNNVMVWQPTVVIVQGMGPRGLMSFQNQNVAVLQANSTQIERVIAAYLNNELQELTDGCQQAHHK